MPVPPALAVPPLHRPGQPAWWNRAWPWARFTPLLLALACAGCIVLPRTAHVYDPACRTYVKQVILETTELGHLGGCVNEGCAVMLASMGMVSAASAVVSGSVAVVGNIVYWLERRGQCPAPAAAGAAPPPLLKEDSRP